MPKSGLLQNLFSKSPATALNASGLNHRKTAPDGGLAAVVVQGIF